MPVAGYFEGGQLLPMPPILAYQGPDFLEELIVHEIAFHHERLDLSL